MVAVFGVFIYITEIIISFNNNDKSLLFWSLPFLFGGIFSAKLAVGAGILAYKNGQRFSGKGS
jgi:hypothetical protein